jgi:hypothetical protein
MERRKQLQSTKTYLPYISSNLKRKKKRNPPRPQGDPRGDEDTNKVAQKNVGSSHKNGTRLPAVQSGGYKQKYSM